MDETQEKNHDVDTELNPLIKAFTVVFALASLIIITVVMTVHFGPSAPMNKTVFVENEFAELAWVAGEGDTNAYLPPSAMRSITEVAPELETLSYEMYSSAQLEGVGLNNHYVVFYSSAGDVAGECNIMWQEKERIYSSVCELN